MRYINASEEIKLPKQMGEDKTLPAILTRMGEVYTPTPKFALTMKQLRSLNKAMDTFESEPDGGYYLLDNDEFEVLKLLVEQYAPSVLVNARNAPAILDALLAAPEKRPAPPSQAVQEAEEVAAKA